MEQNDISGKYQYFLRLQALDGYKEIASKVFLTDRFSSVLSVHHTGKKGNNPHYHFCLTTDYKKDALRKELKKHFVLAKGNRHLSLRDWDGDTKACSYLFHEGTEAILRKGYTDEMIQKYKDTNDVVQSKLVKPIHIVDKVVEHFKQKSYRSMYSRDNNLEVFEYMMSMIKSSGEWLPNKFQASRYMLMIKAKLAETPTQENLLWQELYQDWFSHGL